MEAIPTSLSIVLCCHVIFVMHLHMDECVHTYTHVHVYVHTTVHANQCTCVQVCKSTCTCNTVCDAVIETCRDLACWYVN